MKALRWLLAGGQVDTAMTVCESDENEDNYDFFFSLRPLPSGESDNNFGNIDGIAMVSGMRQVDTTVITVYERGLLLLSLLFLLSLLSLLSVLLAMIAMIAMVGEGGRCPQ